MAKSQGRKSTRSNKLLSVVTEANSGGKRRGGSKEFFSNLWERPASKYVLGGIGLAILGRVGYSLYERYPEIGEFFKENLDVIEEKLAEFRGGHSGGGRRDSDRVAGIH